MSAATAITMETIGLNMAEKSTSSAANIEIIPSILFDIVFYLIVLILVFSPHSPIRAPACRLPVGRQSRQELET